MPDLATHKDHNWPHHKLGCSLEEIPRADSISLILSGSDSEHSGILSLCLPASWLHVYAFAWVNPINIYCQLRVDAVTVSHMPVKSQLDQYLAHLRAVFFSPRGGLGVPSMLQCFRANSSPHHLGINLARCHASTHINWLELLIFISTDAGCSDKHTYVIASVRLVMMPCFDPQRIWMSVACGHMISRVWIWGHFMSPDTSELWAAGEKIEMEIIASFFLKCGFPPIQASRFFFY